MQSDKSLEAERAAFFVNAHKDLEAGVDPVVWESELNRLWPGRNGKFDSQAAFDSFQQENLHWVWPKPQDQDPDAA